MTRRQRTLLCWAAILPLVYALLGFLILPWLVKAVVRWQLPKQLGRPVVLQKLRLNPFTCSTTIGGFAIQEPDGKPFVAWDEVYINFDPAGLFSRRLVFAEVAISNAFGHVQMNRDGTFNFTDISQRFPAKPPPAGQPPGKPPVVQVKHLQVTNSKLVCDDLTHATPFTTTIGPISITLNNFSNDPRNANPYGFTAVTEAGEKLAWRGHFFLGPIRSRGSFSIEGIALGKYAPYYNDFVNLALRGGTLDVSASYAVDLAGGLTTALVSNLTVAVHGLKIGARDADAALVEIPELKLAGTQADFVGQRVEVGTLECTGARFDLERLADGSLNLLALFGPPATKPPHAAATPPSTNAPAPAWVVNVGEVKLADWECRVRGFMGEQLARWQQLRVSGIEAQTRPVALRINAISLVEPQLNAQLTAAATNALAARSAAPAPAQPSKLAGSATPLPPLTIGTISVTNGALSYADQSLSPAAGLSLRRLQVSIRGLSSAPDAVAEIAVTGRIDDVAPLEVTGRINPLSMDATTTMQIALKGVDLVPVGGYAGKYAGYLIRKGKLSVDLKYDIEQRRLKSSNSILVDQFVFGAKTDSPHAVKAPVKLAVAILKDVNGQIKLDVPVEGRIDDPQFRYWRAVGRALGTLFTKVFTAPFSLLGSMFGGGGEELGYQEFAAGSAELIPGQAAKLDVLIKAMTQRPALNLEIAGSIDPAKDVEPLQRQALARRVAALRAEREPGATNAVTAVEYAAYLRELYAGALPEIQAKLAPPPEPPRTNFFTNIQQLAPPGQREPPARVKTTSQAKKAAAELTVETMEQGYLPLIELTDPEYRQLAQARVASVVHYLQGKGGIAADRLLVSTNPTEPVRREGARAVFGLQ